MLFQRRKAVQAVPYDKDNLRPILRCSICNGEQVAGFKNLTTGKFEEIMLIRNSADLDWFMKRYGLSSVDKEY